MKMKEIMTQPSQVKTQRDAVMVHLKESQTITSLEAIENYGITRLASIIHGLRAEGYAIASIPLTKVNRFGNSVTLAKYKYIHPNQSSHVRN